MIFYSLPVRAINYDQGSERFYRINSEEPVTIYRILLRDSIDDWAKDLLDYKLKLMKGLISKEDFKKVEDDSYQRYLGIERPRILN